jgi:hypothetical protein
MVGAELSAPNRSKGAGQLVTLQNGLIGLGSGAASALLFASLTSGSYLSIALFYLAPLPLMIAGLGWSHWSALIGAAAGSALLAGMFGITFFIGFIAVVGAPSWWLSRLAMLARPVPAAGDSNSTEPSVEWFPPGMLVVWCALLGAALVLVAFPLFGLDAASFHAGLSRMITHMLRIETGTPSGQPLNVPGIENVQRMVEVLTVIVPPAAAVLTTIINLINLWLAGRVVKFSSRLVRPWPQLSAMTFPVWLVLLLAAAVGLTFAGGITAIAATIVAASLTVAYAVLGFGVLHEITRGLDSRPFVLGGVYASVLVLGWPMMLLFLLGVIETAAHIRARVAAKRAASPKRPT